MLLAMEHFKTFLVLYPQALNKLTLKNFTKKGNVT